MSQFDFPNVLDYNCLIQQQLHQQFFHHFNPFFYHPFTTSTVDFYPHSTYDESSPSSITSSLQTVLVNSVTIDPADKHLDTTSVSHFSIAEIPVEHQLLKEEREKSAQTINSIRQSHALSENQWQQERLRYERELSDLRNKVSSLESVKQESDRQVLSWKEKWNKEKDNLKFTSRKHQSQIQQYDKRILHLNSLLQASQKDLEKENKKAQDLECQVKDLILQTKRLNDERKLHVLEESLVESLDTRNLIDPSSLIEAESALSPSTIQEIMCPLKCSEGDLRYRLLQYVAMRPLGLRHVLELHQRFGESTQQQQEILKEVTEEIISLYQKSTTESVPNFNDLLAIKNIQISHLTSQHKLYHEHIEDNVKRFVKILYQQQSVLLMLIFKYFRKDCCKKQAEQEPDFKHHIVHLYTSVFKKQREELWTDFLSNDEKKDNVFQLHLPNISPKN